MEILPSPMTLACAIAQNAVRLSQPNPRVGCVITDAQGQILGQGHTQRAGGPHAEVMALRDAAEKGNTVEGATAYVTLEPCSHFGRTPPCADALIAASVVRVVVAMQDPNPLVAGEGLAKLRAAGIAIECGLLEHEARELNIGFVSRMTRGRPWLRVKIAASEIGKDNVRVNRSGIARANERPIDGWPAHRRAGDEAQVPNPNWPAPRLDQRDIR